MQSIPNPTMYSHRKRLLATTSALLTVPFVLAWMHVVDFHYKRYVDNDPLIAPVVLKSITGRIFALPDNRVYEVVGMGLPLEEVEKLLRASNYRVDVQDCEGGGVYFFVPFRLSHCGYKGAWPLISIPLIPVDEDLNERFPIGMGSLVSRSGVIRTQQDLVRSLHKTADNGAAREN